MADSATKQLITTSSVRCFKRCRREYLYRYEYGLRPAADSFALAYGSAFHRCVELLETTGLPNAIDYAMSSMWKDSFTRYTLTAQIRAYAEYWAGQPFIAQTLNAEQVFASDLINPETNRPSQTFSVAGKIDAIVLLDDGRCAIRETKTISEDPASDRYWRRLLMDPQITLYYLEAREMGYEVETIAYDVVRKPVIQPALATPAEKRKYKQDGTLYANLREYDESPEAWGERLFADMIARPTFYLARREIPRLEQDVDEFRFEQWDVAKDIRFAQLNNRWYRNVGRQCDQCAYFDLCAGLRPYEPGTVPTGFQIVENIHGELA